MPRIRHRSPPRTPPGTPTSPWRALLAWGAKALQNTAPLRGFDVYVVGFHCVRGAPDEQMEAHHYCKVVNDEMLQCALFDGNTVRANLIGIEYIVSPRLFGTLPESEKDHWHPHNFEVLSGQLVAPGLPLIAEDALMALLLNSYGKTWHTWHTGRHDTGGGTALPLGEPSLMWSFNRDGECDAALRDDRENALALDTAARTARRQRLAAHAHPQRGVNAMRDDFTDTRPRPGVLDDRP